ncbi:MAG: hypothetical protein QM831_14615 [Kofleriaceae bacterium]
MSAARILQYWTGSRVVVPREEKLATQVFEAARLRIPSRAELVRVDPDRILAVGGGQVTEVQVDRPVDEWPTRSIPITHAFPGAIPPLLGIGKSGEVYELDSDFSLRQIWESGVMFAARIDDSATIYHPETRFLFGTWVTEANGKIRWRRRSYDLFLMAVDRTLLVSRSQGVVSTSSLDGSERWSRPGQLQLVADDLVWIYDFEKTRLVAIDLASGNEHARIEFGMATASLRADASGRGHLLGHTHYWTIDLSSGRVLTRYELGDGPRVKAIRPVNDGLLVGSEQGIHVLPALDGRGSVPEPVWRTEAWISSLLPHQNGMVVVEGPIGDSMMLKWLAPR